jgi:hypothetical protein
MVVKEGTILCDKCNASITRVQSLPADGWPKLHNLCSACFTELHDRSK